MPLQIGSKPQPRRRQTAQTRHQALIVRISFYLIAIAVLLLGFLFGLYQYQNDHKGSAIKEIKSGIADVCLDDHDDTLKSGEKVESAPCNGRASQEWTIDGTLIKHANYCLTAPGNPIKVNTAVVIDKCNGQLGQSWLTSPLDSIQNASSGLCLSIPDGQVKKQLIAANCNDILGKNETWQTSIWSASNTAAATVACNFNSEGEQIACDAAKQWLSWQANPSDHAALLNSYTDGNGYEEWCADFVSYVYKQAGYPLSGGERDNWDEYLAYDVQYDANFNNNEVGSYTPQSGDVAYFNYGAGHVEIVIVGGPKPIFVYGDSAKIDPVTKNGDMAENTITSDGNFGQLVYYLNPQ